MSTICNDDKQATTSNPQFDENVWIVVPAYNEGERLLTTLISLREHYKNIVVVDDGSRDNASALAIEKTNLWVLRHPVNSGQGAALQTGIDFALKKGAEAIVTFDGDGQHDVHDIDHLLEPLRQGQCDMVLGSRFLGSTEGMPLSRWVVLKAAVVFTRIFSRIRVTDTHNGLRAFSRKAARKIQITLNRMAHASEILDQIRIHDLRFRECPVTIRYNEHTLAKGQSSWNSFRIVAQLFMSKMMR
ncbi:MAG: glycosyltransferase involved in cell wall biosynthesis [Pirellulaceae bacterium]|jgi:glycosyltransferase involved in cell wall biosynthesis